MAEITIGGAGVFGTTQTEAGEEAAGPIFNIGEEEDTGPDLWESQTLGDNSYIKAFAECAQKALDLHKANSKFVRDFYEINKAFLLSTIDPLFAALDAILDEIIKILQDLKSLGFYMLPVTATSVRQNVTKNPVTGTLFVGGQAYVPARRNMKGELVPAGFVPGTVAPSSGVLQGARERATEMQSMSREQIDAMNVARDPISGEINYVADASVQPMNTVLDNVNPDSLLLQGGGADAGDVGRSATGAVALAKQTLMMVNPMTHLVQLTPQGILRTIDESFDDANDVPKHILKKIREGTAKTTDGEKITKEMWNPTDMKKLENLVDPSYYQSGRPIFSDSSVVGGMIFIIGAPDANRFLTVMENFQKFFDVRSFKSMTEDIVKLWEDDEATHRIKVQHVANIDIGKLTKEEQSAGGQLYDDTTLVAGADEAAQEEFHKKAERAGSFRAQPNKGPRMTDRRIMTDGGKVARIKEVVETKNMLLEEYKPADMSWNAGPEASRDMDLTERRIRAMSKTEKVNKNVLPYQQQILDVVMQFPGEEFKPGELIYECLPTSTSAMHSTTDDGKVTKVDDVIKDAEASPMGTTYGQIKPGQVTVGRVVNSFIGEGVGNPPNWYGKSLETLFPGWGPFLDKVEGEVRGMKATVAVARKSFDPIIKWLDNKVAELEVFGKDIENILDLFANGLPAPGVYTLYLKPKAGGTKVFRERMLGAGGPNKPPEDLKFCAGLCFLGGGSATNATKKAINMLALLLGVRDKTADEKKAQAKLTQLAIPAWTNVGPLDKDGNPTTKFYKKGDKVYYRGKNYECILDTKDDPSETGAPLIKDTAVDPDTGVPSGLYILNGVFWKPLDLDLGPDEEVIAGDPRSPQQLKKDKLAWLDLAKTSLQSILNILDGPSAASLRSKIMKVALFGKINILTGLFEGENYNVFIELKQMRDNCIYELDLLVERIEEIITEIDIMQIVSGTATLYSAENPDGVRPGSLRTKGKTLMLVGGGQFKDFVDTDDFLKGDRKIKKNTTITIMDPLSDASGSTRAVEKLSNSTVAVLDEAFEADVGVALSYDIFFPKSQNFPPYNTTDNAANTTHYKHPGYRLREFYAKANTVSVVAPESNGEYKDLPLFEDDTVGTTGAKRTESYYPRGTIIKLNGTSPLSDQFLDEPDNIGAVEETALGQVAGEGIASSWMGIGVSQDDILVISFGSDTEITASIEETIGVEYIAISAPIRQGAQGAIEMFKYHENWSVKISDAGATVAAKSEKVQKSRQAFTDHLTYVNALAEQVYQDLDVLSNKNWPDMTSPAKGGSSLGGYHKIVDPSSGETADTRQYPDST